MDIILDTYYLTRSTVKTALCLNLSYRAVNKYLKDKGVELKVGNLVKHSFLYDFFKNPTLENSYWAGFIAGDGYISRNNIILSISKKDESHLQKFKNTLHFSGELKEYTHNLGFSKNYKYNRISLSSKTMCEDLKTNWCIVKNKTWKLMFPDHLDKEVLFSYVLGYIDADGSFCRNNGVLRSLNICGTFDYLIQMKIFLFNYLNIEESSIHIYPDHSIHRIMITRKHVLEKINTIVLTKFSQLPLLERKWSILRETFVNRASEDFCFPCGRNLLTRQAF